MSRFEIAMILGMTLITFAIRYTLFAVGHRVRFNPMMVKALNYVPVAVLSAIVMPAMLMPQGEGLELSLNNHYLVGGIAAICIAAYSRNLLATIAGGIVCFFLWRWFYA